MKNEFLKTFCANCGRKPVFRRLKNGDFMFEACVKNNAYKNYAKCYDASKRNAIVTFNSEKRRLVSLGEEFGEKIAGNLNSSLDADEISDKRFFELMFSWNQHCPFFFELQMMEWSND